MEKALSVGKTLYEHPLIRYAVIGGTTFSLDFALLILFHGVMGINVLIAASASYWIAISFNFVANRFWTFGASDTASIGKHLVAYLALLGFNYLFTVGFIGVATHAGMYYTLAKVLALVCQISWTYVAYKKIFR